MTVALLVIDMQNAYFEDETLAAEQDRLVANCNQLIIAAREAECPVFLVCTEHERDRSTWTLSMLDDNQGFIFTNSTQARTVPGLRTDNLPRVVKTRDSGFVGTNLLQRLRTVGATKLVLTGVSTHNCVAQTAADAFAHNFRVAYARDAIASNRPDYAEQVLKVLSDEYRQDVLGMPEAVELLEGGH